MLIASKSSHGSDPVDGEPQKKSREDWRKAKELEEARKAGTAPAAVDEEGRDINPHIPQYISSAPWYYNTVGPTLKHQRPQDFEKQENFAKVGEWFPRGVNVDTITTKFRKGACENCGAMTHKKKDCMERPRKVLAKYSGEEIAPDEFAQPNLKLDFDGKRDRWNGYNPADHASVIEEYEKVEEVKRQLKAQKLATGEADPDEEDEDEDKYVDEVDMPGTKVDSKQRITVRNLRIREDTAKYLRNLDPNSAYYDPKTRSMRENPYKGTGKEPEQVDFAGENFVRFSGDTTSHAQAQMFAWEAQNLGVDVHLLAEPTKAEKLKAEYVGKKDEVKSTIQESILERYGGREHLDAPPKALLLAQTEHYVEYSRSGKVIKGAEKPVVCSRYEEDIYSSNHTSVWGSFWKDGQWGYQCCHSLIYNSYCTGDRGKEVVSEEEKVPLALTNTTASTSASTSKQIQSRHTSDSDDDSDEDGDMKRKRKEDSEESEGTIEERKRRREENEKSEERRRKKRDRRRKKKKSEKKKKQSKNKDSSSDSDSESDEEAKKEKRVAEAIRKEEQRQKEVDRLLKLDERKRPFNSMVETQAPTEEEMEAYYRKRKRDEDPMSAFL